VAEGRNAKIGLDIEVEKPSNTSIMRFDIVKVPLVLGSTPFALLSRRTKVCVMDATKKIVDNKYFRKLLL
jgi:hypothetical protein